MTTVLQFTHAVAFAADRHAHQRRKGEAGEPYINHLADVARIVAEATGGRDPALVIAALLHDTLEDTRTTFDELSQEFGENVALLVRELSQDKSLSKAERKQREIDEAASKSNRAKVIKLADLLSNLRSVIHSPPADWSADEREAYVDWAEAVARGMTGASRILETELRTAFGEARHAVRLARYGR